MKKIFLFIAITVAVIAVGCCSTKMDTRDYAYEAYCNDIWENFPEYYDSVLMYDEEYNQYVLEHGEFWEDYNLSTEPWDKECED